MRLSAILLGGLLLAGCRAEPAPEQARERPSAAAPASSARPNIPATAEPSAPTTRGGLPDAPGTVSEAPIAATSAEAAAVVVRTYFALAEAGRHSEAVRLWEGAGKAGAFATGLGRYRDYRAEVGPPGRMEAAAGSSYVAVPVRLQGRLKDGTPVRRRIEVTLRRVNDVPGATEDQRRWRILDIAPAEASE